MPRSLLSLVLVAALVAPACAQPMGGSQVKSVITEAGPVAVKDVVGGLNHPWAMAFLPDGRLLVTERNTGNLYLVADSTISDALAGVPEVWAQGQGGLLDVAIDPDFEENSYVYLSYSEPGGGGASTALGRGRFTGDRIEGFEKIFTQLPKVDGPNHFGNRIVFDGQGHLFLTLGERFKFDPAQDLASHLGKVVRLRHDGSVPADNPFVGQADAEDAIWSYGHRNIQAAALHPETGDLWVAEFGPRGGDELNRPRPGENYGWPEVSWGMHYDGRPIPDPPTRPEFADAALHWTPVISPSGMTYYTGGLFPAWQGSFLIGGLSSNALVRVVVDGEAAQEVERIPLGARIRDVAQGPDGAVYLLTDAADGHVWRLEPME